MNPTEAIRRSESLLDSLIPSGPLGMVVLGNPLEHWILSIAIFVTTGISFYIFRYRLLKYLAILAEKTETKLDDLFVSLIMSTHKVFYIVFSAFIASHALILSAKVDSVLTRGTISIFILQGVYWANQTITFWVKMLAESRFSESGQKATFSGLSFLGRTLVWTVAILLILDNLGINISTLVTGLGIGGVAVALAVQNVLGDLLASLSIILDKPFVVGDSITVEQLQGTVEHIGLKTTRVRSVSGEIIVFSNTDLLKSRIRNYRHMQERRIVFLVNVSPQVVAEKLEIIPKIIRGATEQPKSIRFDRAHFKEITTQAFVFEIVYFVLTSDYATYMNIQQDVNLEIVRRFAQEEIALATPTQTVIVADFKR